MDLAFRNITLHRRDRGYRLLLVERDDIAEEVNLPYGRIVINTENLDYASLRSRFIDLFLLFGDGDDAIKEADLLLEFCSTGRIKDEGQEI